MPVFIYNIERRGQLVKGEIKARSLQLAQIKLKSRNIDPIYIKQKPLIPFFSGGGGVKSTVVLFFTRQLSFLLGAGVSLVQSLEMCVSTIDHLHFKQVLQSIVKQLEAGKSFSQALKTRPDIFSGFYVNMIVCAEETGLMDQVLKDMADYMEKSESIKSKVKSASMYPAIVMFISLSIISGIIIFIVPKFEALYAGNGGTLPALTQSMVRLSDLMRNNTMTLLASIVMIPIVFIQYSRTESGKINIQRIVKALPLFGKIQYQFGLVRFCRSFYSLLKSGVNFLDALNITHNIAGHPDIQKGITVSKDYVTKGKSFAKGLEDSKVFPPLVYQMVKIGEESGKIDQAFEKLAVYYEEQLEDLIDGLIKMIEPILIVFLGGIIGIIILALYLPVFNMGDIVS